MKILIVTQDFPPQGGGIAVLLSSLCNAAVKTGDEVEVIAPLLEGCSSWDQARSFPVRRYRVRRRLTSLRPTFKVLWRVKRGRPSVILVGHFMSTHALGVVLVRLLWGIPYALFIHGYDAISLLNGQALDRWIGHLVLRHASLLLTNSRYMRGRLIKEGWARSEVVVMNPGVDTTLFQPGADSGQVKARLGLEGKKVAITVARLVRKKNHETVLRAIPLVLKSVPNFCYLIVGAGEEEGRLRLLAGQLGVEKAVVFAGRIRHEDLPAYYCACDVLVMPSCEVRSTGDVETFGIVFCEASACGKPVIGSRSGGIEDAVVDGLTGLLVDPGSVEEIAEAIVRVLSDRELAERLGRAGRARVETEYTWERAWEKMRASLALVANMRGLND